MNKEQVYKYIKSKNIWYEIKEHKTFFKRKNNKIYSECNDDSRLLLTIMFSCLLDK